MDQDVKRGPGRPRIQPVLDTLDEIRRGEPPSTPPIEEPPSDTDNAVECETLETAGVITDGQGHRWAIPAEGLGDFAGIEEVTPFVLTKRDPRMRYETRGIKENEQFIREGWVPVTREEVGAPTAATAKGERDYGLPITGTGGGHPYVVGDTILVKLPHVLAKRRQALTEDLRQKQRAAVEHDPTRSAKNRAERDGRPVHMEVRRGAGGYIEEEAV